MKCAVSVESQKKIIEKLAHDLNKKIINKETFNLKEAVTEIYNLVYNKTKDHTQALDYARLIPGLINKLQAGDIAFAKLLLDSNIDSKELMKYSVNTYSEDALEKIEAFMGLNTKDHTIEELRDADNNAKKNNTSEKKSHVAEDIKTEENKNKSILKEGDNVQLLTNKKVTHTIKKDNGNTVLLSNGKSVLKTKLIKVKKETKVKESLKSDLPKDFYIAPYTDGDWHIIYNGDNKLITEEQLQKGFPTREAAVKYAEELNKLIQPKIFVYKGITVKRVDNRSTKKNKSVAAKKLQNGTIEIDDKEMHQKFKEKAWMHPTEQLDEQKSKAQPLNENSFDTYEEFEKFVLEHEYQHTKLKKKESETIGDYETRINNAALKALGLYEKATGKENTENITDPKKLLNEKVKEAEKLKKEKEFEKQKLIPETPTPRRNFISSMSVNIAEIFYQVWRAGAPTFLADQMYESMYGAIGKRKNMNRIPYKEHAFDFGIKRHILQELLRQNIDQDSTKLTIDGRTGIYLTAMNAAQLAKEPGINIDLTKDPNHEGVYLVLTNEWGQLLRFDNDYHIVLEGGNIPKYALRNHKNVLSEDGKLNQAAAKRQIDSLIRSYNMPSSKYKEARAIAIAQLEKELNLIKTVREHINKNPEQNTVQFKINGGSLGHIDKSTLDTTLLKEVKEGEIKSITKHDEEASNGKYKKGVLYITSPEMYGDKILLETPGVAESGHADIIDQLLFENIKTDTGEQLSVKERREALRTFVNIGSDDIDIIRDKENPDRYVVKINGDIYDIDTPEQIKNARQELKNFINLYKNAETLTIEQIKRRNGKIISDPKKAELNSFVKDINGNWRRQVRRFRIHGNKDLLNKNVNVPSIEKNSNGENIIRYNKQDYRTFMADSKFEVDTPDVASDGKLRRTNAYFTFALTEQGENEVYGNTLNNEHTNNNIQSDEKLIESKINEIIKEDVTYTDDDGNICAAHGLTNSVMGTNWKIVKDFYGKPKHSHGGVDITISDKGVIMRRGGKDIKAKHGLLIINK